MVSVYYYVRRGHLACVRVTYTRVPRLQKALGKQQEQRGAALLSRCKTVEEGNLRVFDWNDRVHGMPHICNTKSVSLN